jgi:hypothetical protein
MSRSGSTPRLVLAMFARVELGGGLACDLGPFASRSGEVAERGGLSFQRIALS